MSYVKMMLDKSLLIPKQLENLKDVSSLMCDSCQAYGLFKGLFAQWTRVKVGSLDIYTLIVKNSKPCIKISDPKRPCTLQHLNELTSNK